MCRHTAKRLLNFPRRLREQEMSQITVFTAKRIRTMNPSLPIATAVAVRGDQIIEVGTLETMRPWLDAHPHRIDTTFKDHVILPGFIAS